MAVALGVHGMDREGPRGPRHRRQPVRRGHARGSRAVWDAYQPILGAANDRKAFGEGASGNVPPDAPLWQRLLDITGRR